MIEGGKKQGMRYDEIRALLADHFREMLDRRKKQMGQSGQLSELDRKAYENGIWVASEALAGDDTPGLLTGRVRNCCRASSI